MSAVTHLDAQNYCPVCAASRQGSSGQPATEARGKSVTVYFSCGGTFASFGDAPIETIDACPAPSEVATRALNAKVVS